MPKFIPDENHVYDTIVVGGGIAGLVASYALQEAGGDVLVLEASERPGGRLHTVHYDGVYAEAGAMVVTDEEYETMDLYRANTDGALIELGAHGTEMCFGDKLVSLRRFDGSIGSPRDILDLFRLLFVSLSGRNSNMPRPGLRLFLAYRRAVREIRSQTEAFERPYKPGARTGWDNLTFIEFLDSFHPSLKNYVDMQLKVTAGETAECISLFWGLVTFNWNIGSFYWPRGGVSKLSFALAEKMPGRILTGARVLSVNDGKPCDVVYMESEERRYARASTVVVAVPASEALNIVRGVPNWKLDALKAVPYGSYITIHFVCRRRFWEHAIRTGYLNCAGGVFTDLIDGTRGQQGETGILIGFIAGPDARRLVDADDKIILSEALEDLKRIFPRNVGDVMQTRVFKWKQGIPYFPPNYEAAFEKLREPCGRISFCGDYTQGAGIHDAVLSGLEAAKSVRESLRSETNAVQP